MTTEQRLKALQESKSSYPTGQDLLSALSTDSRLRREVKYLTLEYLHRELTGCSSCAMDAYLELMRIKNTSMEEKKYELRAGVLLYDRETDSHFSNFNITDEVAERLLKTNPKLAAQFRKLPEAKPDGKAAEDVILDAEGRTELALEMLRAKSTKKAVLEAVRGKGALLREAEEAFVAAVEILKAENAPQEL